MMHVYVEYWISFITRDSLRVVYVEGGNQGICENVSITISWGGGGGGGGGG